MSEIDDLLEIEHEIDDLLEIENELVVVNKLDDLIRQEVITTLIRNRKFSAYFTYGGDEVLHYEIIQNLLDKKIVWPKMGHYKIKSLINKAMNVTNVLYTSVCKEDANKFLNLRISAKPITNIDEDTWKNIRKEMYECVIDSAKFLLGFSALILDDPNIESQINEAIIKLNSDNWKWEKNKDNWIGSDTVNAVLNKVATLVANEINNRFEYNKTENKNE